MPIIYSPMKLCPLDGGQVWTLPLQRVLCAPEPIRGGPAPITHSSGLAQLQGWSGFRQLQSRLCLLKFSLMIGPVN